MKTKKIGFVDLYISEWHANNYPVWMTKIAEELGYSFKIEYAWAERDVSPLDNVTTAEWCERFGAKKCETIDELCEKSDMIVILAPSNPEVHLKYAEAVLKHGKPTYIDKTFAPDAETSSRIFALSEKYGAPFFSTSALRFAEELALVEAPSTVITTGNGSSADEYIIHQIEMIVAKLGIGAKAVRATAVGSAVCFHILYDDGRAAQMTYSSDSLGFSIFMSGKNGSTFKKIYSDFFKVLMKDILVFFETGRISFDTAQTQEVMKIREGALKAMNTPDTQIEL